MSNYYFPSNDKELSAWAANFRTKIETLSVALGLSTDQVTAMQKHCDAIVNQTLKIAENKRQLKALRETLKLTIDTDGATLRNAISNIKTSSSYTASIGQELGVISSHYGFKVDEYKPKIEVQLFTNYLKFKYQKKGVDSLNIYYRKKNTTEWILLARTSKSPFEYPLTTIMEPEKWEIRAVGVIDDKEVGKPCDIIELLVSR